MRKSGRRKFLLLLSLCVVATPQSLLHTSITVCGSLGFDDNPDYARLKRLFHDLFIREGFQGYVFHWNILKYQQSQIATPSAHAIGPAAGPSSGVPPAVVNADRQQGVENGRHTGWSSSDPSQRRNSGPIGK